MPTTVCDCNIGPGAGPEVDVGASAGAAQRQDASAKPFDLEFVSISRREHVELKSLAHQYRSLHARAVERIKWLQQRHDRELTAVREQLAAVQAELALARAQNRDLRQRVFGAKTEQSRSVNALLADMTPPDAAASRRRGQQPGRPSS